MKISERTIKRLGEIITGDKPVSAYRSGLQLVRFFNEFGTNQSRVHPTAQCYGWNGSIKLTCFR